MKTHTVHITPTIRKECPSNDHYANLIMDGECFACHAVWGLGTRDEFQEVFADDEMKHREPPSDDEMDAMYEHSQLTDR